MVMGPLLHSHAAYPSAHSETSEAGKEGEKQRGVFSNPRIGVGDDVHRHTHTLSHTLIEPYRVCVMLAMCGLNLAALHSSCLSLFFFSSLPLRLQILLLLFLFFSPSSITSSSPPLGSSVHLSFFFSLSSWRAVC
ncbi:hypothetical protein CHARACLAT_030546 [Characodon lateralis]|uniref:Uncharacterized protein n=1 Tax=Characodon lateralis TaxID=208331 RepID=A0ABU7F8C2_9TELE|nr:hypothetical protein [Characodon lateralis]